MCFELLDTESESRQGSENEEEEGESRDEKQMALETYVSRFLGPGEPPEPLPRHHDPPRQEALLPRALRQELPGQDQTQDCAEEDTIRVREGGERNSGE